MAIDLNHLIVFSRVVQAGSFSGAARALGVPKATVSRSVARLEAEVGVRLLHRTTRRIELTSIGRAYLDEVSVGLSHLEAAAVRVAAAQQAPSGTLRLSSPVYFGVRYLIDWVAEFCARHEGVRIELRLSDEYEDIVENGIDIAIRTGKLASSTLIARRLGPARRIMVASPGYLAKRSQPRTLEDLLHHDVIVLGPTMDGVLWRLQAGSGVEEIHLSGRLAVNSAHGALQAAVAGVGIALLPEGVVRDDLAADRLAPVLPDYSADAGGLYAVYASGRHMTAAHRALVELLVEKVRSSD